MWVNSLPPHSGKHSDDDGDEEWEFRITKQSTCSENNKTAPVECEHDVV